MCDRFNHGALQVAVAQICQSMGWDALQKSTHDLLTDVLQKYLEEIAKSAHGYCQLYSRTEPNLDDLNQAFQDIGVCLHELEDFVSQVDQVPFIHQLPRFPKPKACVLHHPRNGEVAERLEQYYDYLPPLVSKLLQNEDEEKAANEDADTADTEKEIGTAEGFVRSEIKTVAEETSNAPVAVKRPHEHPPGLENETKKRRVDFPFMQKGNRGNEMDILEALQGNLSSPSPTPSPDVWSTAKTFDMPSTSDLPHVTAAHPADKASSSKTTTKPKVEQKKAIRVDKPVGKQGEDKPKSSPKKKVKAPKSTTSPAAKSASPSLSTPAQLPKEKSPSLIKSPLAKKKPATPEKETKTKKPISKKDKKPAAKAKKPVLKSPPTNKEPAASKENIVVKESMPKLIIKPIKKEVNKEPQFTVSEFLPSDDVGQKGKPQQKKQKIKDSTSKKEKNKMKEGVIPSIKMETKAWSTPCTSEELKFSMAELAVAHPPAEIDVSGKMSVDPALEHKKKKKKRKEKDKDKEKKKDKSKKLKTEHADPCQSLATPHFPRITVKLEPPPHSTSVTSKAEPSAMAIGTASSQMVGSLNPESPKVSVKQEPSVTSVPKLTIKTESLERTVVSQTVSTTVVHGDVKVYYCPVCSDPDDGALMIGCDGCDEWFHGRCVGIVDDPGDVDWFCSSCLAQKDKDSKDKQKKKKKKKSKDKEK